MKKRFKKDGQYEIPAKDSLAQFFGRMSFTERIEPVLARMGEILCGETQPGRPMPAYCHAILSIFRRTYFKNFPALADIVLGDGKSVQVDWRHLGKMIGVALRCLRFGRCELDQALPLTPEQEKEIIQLLAVSPEADETFWNTCAARIESAFMEWNQRAFQWGPAAFAELNAGVSEGMKGFMDESGGFTGESNRANIYWFLLLAWPEIQTMQRSCPPVTRKQFGEWIEPFAKAGIISLGSIEQLHDVCEHIGLKFKERGRPPKDLLPVCFMKR